ncbi:unnamed protein product [Rhizoctonia solani]|uniref:PNPLA domain-containing protein n=1 Tax=Rhizoctonia solani TaxID=456999 RepID=A0A8H3ARU9_9AGAM|nr:unnamed protein product [Rhizoctonia solani]
MPKDRETSKGLNILCIDGGGTRGLSSLIVLQEIMHRVESANGGKRLHPYEHFDIIAGTGTGGISACMLGRLQMPIQKAIREYTKLMESVFASRKLTGSTMYKGTRLQEALKTLVQDATGDEDKRILEGSTNSACKTVVFAMAKHNLNAGLPVMFRSYAVTSNCGPNCAIWQALYATMAHPDLFKKIDIPSDLGSQSFVGGELGCSNPITHVLSEANWVYPDRQVACVVSIGAGHARTIQVPDPGLWRLLLRTHDAIVMKEMAMDSERVAEEMALRFRDTKNVYFRFNVDQGLQGMDASSWERQDEVTAHTLAYLRRSEINQGIGCAIRSSMERLETISTGQIGGLGTTPAMITDGHILDHSAKQPTKFKSCPPPTPMYTGREMENTQLATCITGSTDERRVGVVYGLGGTGKTQLALNVVERTRDEWQHVLFVDASSKQTIEQTLKGFAILKGIGGSYEVTLQWLEGCHERWLVVFDNADNPSTNIRHYVPGGRHGSILITTRLPDLAGLAKGPGSICRLSSMIREDGLALLIKASRLGGQRLSDNEIEAGEALLKDFGYLALAIIHAGAFIAHMPGMTLVKYRSLFAFRRKTILEQYRDLPASAKLDDYGETVYTTWKLCYQQLQPESRLMLSLISHLHYDGIFEAIFERAALRMELYEDYIPLTSIKTLAQSHVKQYLSTFLDGARHWDSLRFAQVMADLVSFSLVDFDRMNLAYNIHILVQDWARAATSQVSGLATEYATVLLSLSIDWEDDTASLAFKRRLGVHASSVLGHNPELGVNHAVQFVSVYQATGQFSEALKLEAGVLKVTRQVLGKEHPNTLSSMGRLAGHYHALGQYREAEQLQIKALELHRRLLGEEHQDTLTVMNNLASAYSGMDRWHEAEQLATKVLSIQKRLLGEQHPNTLASMSNLAFFYNGMGQQHQAEQLQVHVLSVHKQLLGEEHPSTLASMNNLACTYKSLNRLDEAEELFKEAVGVSKRVLGDSHPDTHGYQNNLKRLQTKRHIWSR